MVLIFPLLLEARVSIFVPPPERKLVTCKIVLAILLNDSTKEVQCQEVFFIGMLRGASRPKFLPGERFTGRIIPTGLFVRIEFEHKEDPDDLVG